MKTLKILLISVLILALFDKISAQNQSIQTYSIEMYNGDIVDSNRTVNFDSIYKYLNANVVLAVTEYLYNIDIYNVSADKRAFNQVLNTKVGTLKVDSLALGHFNGLDTNLVAFWELFHLPFTGNNILEVKEGQCRVSNQWYGYTFNGFCGGFNGRDTISGTLIDTNTVYNLGTIYKDAEHYWICDLNTIFDKP